MANIKEKLHDRFNILGISFILIASIIILQLVNLQVINGQDNYEQSQRKLFNERDIPAARGNIVDRYGVPIATNRMGFTIQIIDTNAKPRDLNAMILKLVGILEQNGDAYNRTLSKYITFNPVSFGSSIVKAKNKVGVLKTLTGFTFKGVPQDASAQELFQYFKTQFKIDDKYSDEQAYKIMTIRFEILGYSVANAICIAKDVSKETVAEVEERHREFPGVNTDTIPVRKYIDAQDAAQVIGYVGNIDPETYKNKKDDGYGMNDIIGKLGVEYAEENYLRGIDGQKRVEVDTSGRLTDQLNEEPAKPGDNVVLTLDMRLQKVAMESLAKNIEAIRNNDDKNNFHDAFAGAVVAMDVNSGEILALASYPSYDPSAFIAPADDKEAQAAIAALKDPNKASQYNRAISGSYTPGSTFKPLVAIAGLEEGKITPETIIPDAGYMDIDGMRFTTLEYRNYRQTLGNLNLEKALALSCNTYFYQVGMWAGIDNIDKWARLFGLGEKTGLDLPGESRGVLASKEFKKTIDKAIFSKADTAQASIGQLYNSFTPLQLVNYVSTLANGGKKFKPHLIKRIVKYDGSTVMETVPEFDQIPVKADTVAAVKKGMLAVTSAELSGTAAHAFDDLPFKVAGKTGTAETGYEKDKHSSNALFVCYAPADNPQIAVAVVVERGVFGAYTAPIAHDILAEYFDVNKKSNPDDQAKPDTPELLH